MSAITIRNLDPELKRQLRIRAAACGHSMEEEALHLRRSPRPQELPRPRADLAGRRAGGEVHHGLPLDLSQVVDIHEPAEGAQRLRDARQGSSSGTSKCSTAVVQVGHVPAVQVHGERRSGAHCSAGVAGVTSPSGAWMSRVGGEGVAYLVVRALGDTLPPPQSHDLLRYLREGGRAGTGELFEAIGWSRLVEGRIGQRPAGARRTLVWTNVPTRGWERSCGWASPPVAHGCSVGA
ncbi:MAG: hypothetical protein WD250_15895 [Egibacteraceae bacterium]